VTENKHKLAVAPMMDWADWGGKAKYIQYLSRAEFALLYRMQYHLRGGIIEWRSMDCKATP
jgi:hypothetical protein